MHATMIVTYSMTSCTEGLGHKSIEVVLSARMSAGPIKIESLRDITIITFQDYRNVYAKTLECGVTQALNID